MSLDLYILQKCIVYHNAIVSGIISSIGIIGLVIGYGLGALVNKNYVTFEGTVHCIINIYIT